MSQQQITQIAIENLDPHPHNPRGQVDPEAPATLELVESIREQGIVQPLVVVPQRAAGAKWKIERYTVVCGHRRRIAAPLAGLSEVPCIVRDLEPIQQEEVMLTENLQRDDLTLYQEALAFKRILDGGVKQSDLARRIGCAAARIQQRLKILELTQPVQLMFNSYDLPVTAAPLLLQIDKPERQERLAQMVASRRLTILKFKEMVEKMERAGETRKPGDGRSSAAKAAKKAALYTRKDAVRDLEAQIGTILTYADLLTALKTVCKKCGLENHPETCNACPLPELIGNLVRGGGRA